MKKLEDEKILSVKNICYQRPYLVGSFRLKEVLFNPCWKPLFGPSADI